MKQEDSSQTVDEMPTQAAPPELPPTGNQWGVSMASPVIATILASFLGGVFGFGGSLLIFWNSQESLKQTRTQYFFDIQRNAYSDLALHSMQVRIKLHYAAIGAVKAGKTVNISDCDDIDQLTNTDARLIQVRLVGAQEVVNVAQKLNKVVHDWQDLLCTPGSQYTQEMRDATEASFDSAMSTYWETARNTERIDEKARG